MTMQSEIDKALLAHGAWKQRLSSAINSGSSDFQVTQVQVDNLCEFGRWFYSLPEANRTSAGCQKIQKLHADFHAEAARILDLAITGRKDEAVAALAPGSRFTSLSGQLMMALNQWKRDLNQP
ncbi:MAG TPA: CZB domain-containing protein [Anaerolineaceae bacterium]|mgnify:CR=1 FL=1|nr:CZB domain-containing protein [Anaerolineaceae bacterium]HPN54057.1 CZB domain-containing protein [Anaerolineaceae bacterium]